MRFWRGERGVVKEGGERSRAGGSERASPLPSPFFNFAAHPLPRILLRRTRAHKSIYAPVPRRLVIGLESEDGADVGDVIPGRLEIINQLDDGQSRRGVTLAAVVRREIDDAVRVAGQAFQSGFWARNRRRG